MTDGRLAGLAVLVTRPAHQAAGLSAAIVAAGGHAIAFPVIDIEARDTQAIQADVARLPAADIVVFVSTNAVEYGLGWIGDSRIAAVGPATAAAIEAAGRIVDIRPAGGFDSESLLAEPALNDVDGSNVTIVRGESGRELLADTLRERGARVDYLPVYARRLAVQPGEDRDAIAARLRSRDIAAVTVMSVESLRNLLALLPASCHDALAKAPLVTPAERVIKEAIERLPGCITILADGPGAEEMVSAIETLGQRTPGPDS